MKKLSAMFHFVMNLMLTGLILVGIGIAFLMATDSKDNRINGVMIESNYSSEAIRNPQISTIQGNPEKWIILDTDEDLSLAKVLKEDGHMYYMTIYNAYDNIISIECNGQIHEFYYTK